MTSRPIVDHRYPETGFVYVNDTRMLFHESDIFPNTLILEPSNWGIPTEAEIRACKKALANEYPHYTIRVLTPPE